MADMVAMANDLLDRVAAYFAEQSVDLPSVRHVAPGSSQVVAFDANPDGSVRECVMVAADFLSPGQPGQDEAGTFGQNPFAFRRYAQFGVTILRQVAVQDEAGNSPAPEVIDADGQTSMRDLLTLQLALEHVRAGSLSPGGWAEHGTPVVVGRTQNVGPAGASVATVGVIQAVVV